MTTIAPNQFTRLPRSSNLNASPLKLPRVTIATNPIEWGTMHRRFINPGEMETLVALLRHHATVDVERMIEFGCNEGRTSRVLLNNVPTLKEYVGVDVLPGYVTAKPVQRREVPQNPGHLAASDPRFHIFVTRNGSFDLEPEKHYPGVVFDAAFIDGDHGWRGVLHDTLLARRMVRPGGLIIWHDYHGRDSVDVRQVLETFHANGSPIYHAADTWIAFERV